jgi:hypothetical protein
MVYITQDLILRIKQFLESSIGSKLSNINLKVQGDIRTIVIKWNNRSVDLMKASMDIIPLPFPENTIQVAVV